MNIEFKDHLRAAFREGFAAFQEGLKIRDNPYFSVYGTDQELLYDEWICGWYQGAEDE